MRFVCCLPSPPPFSQERVRVAPATRPWVEAWVLGGGCRVFGGPSPPIMLFRWVLCCCAFTFNSTIVPPHHNPEAKRPSHCPQQYSQHEGDERGGEKQQKRECHMRSSKPATSRDGGKRGSITWELGSPRGGEKKHPWSKNEDGRPRGGRGGAREGHCVPRFTNSTPPRATVAGTRRRLRVRPAKTRGGG